MFALTILENTVGIINDRAIFYPIVFVKVVKVILLFEKPIYKYPSIW